MKAFRWVELLFLALAIFIFASIFSGCATSKPILNRGSLSTLLFVPRPGYKGLTNQRCTQWDKDNIHCLARDTIDFDLAKDEDRLRLHAIKLVCHVGSQEYRVCLQLPGLCQQTIVKSGLFGWKKEIKLVSVLTMPERLQYLIDTSTWCVAMDGDLASSDL